MFYKLKNSINAALEPGKTRAMLMLIVSVLLFVNLPIAAHASSFSHYHGDDCYETRQEVCTNHSVGRNNYTTTKHCTTCLVQTTHSVTCYYDVCNSGLVPSVELGFYISCRECGNVAQNDNWSLRPPHGYTARVLACGLEEGNNLGTVSLSKSTDAWTNGNVILTASVNGMPSALSLASAPYDFGNGYSSSCTYEATSNGTYRVTVKASDGSTAYADISVNNIDRTAPSVSLSKSTEAWSENGITVTASASDSESGLADACYSFDGGAYGSEKTLFVNSNRKVTVSVKDRAGNVSTESITVSNIGRDPAVIAAEKAEQEAREKAEREAREKAEREAREKAEREATGKQESGSSTINKGNVSQPEYKDSSKDKNQQNALQKGDGSQTGNNNQSTKPDADKSKDKDSSGSDSGTTGKDGVNVTPGKAGSITGLLIVNNKNDDDTSDNKTQDDNITTGLYGSDSGNVNNGESPNSVNADAADVTNDASGAGTDDGSNNSLGKASGSSDSYAAMVVLAAGGLFLLIGLLMLFNVNYIYKSEKGRIKLVSRVKVKRQEKRIIVYVSSGKLKKGGRYMIYFSPVNRLLKKKKRVYVMINETETLVNTDEGIGFTY